MSVPAIFDYHPAQSLDEAIALLQQYGDDAKVLAGGHSLIPAMKLRLSQPAHLIDIARIDGLSYIREDGDVVAIGAMTTYTTLAKSDLLRQRFPLLTDTASVLGDQQVRNRGTLGGSIAHSDPAGDMPGVVLALKATIVAKGPNGSRTIAADDFFVGTFETALAPDEILTEIRLPLPGAHTGSAYIKLENKASHYAITGSAVVLTLDNAGVCSAASLTITGASTQTVRATAAEAALVGKKLDSAVIADAASHAADGMEAVADIHGSAEYRRQMTNVIAQRALLKALERAQA
ncbi:MAG TPA: xanthine dehydrogenase family protein subunit M [Ktedonobacteraceae bacterium]|jgi:carbon-monoxide dehydrogenase medium subunit|nr:xanthine dehydrogenase family protein subunit M [Ktedonobacteraceae bacterium]